jgi:hypothetical protein
MAVTIAAAGLISAAPATSSAAVTIGTPLDQPTSTASDVSPGRTVMTLAYAGAQLTSPIDGVVVRYRVQSTAWGNISLRILRPAGAGAFDGVGTSTPAFVGGVFDDLTHQVGARLPIAAGDQIGIDSDSSVTLRSVSSSGWMYGYWDPKSLDSDAPSVPNVGSSDTSVLFNADVEADADHDGFGDETQDSCPGVAGPQAGCPNPTVQTKKKCKHHKKHRSAESAKKKCKKRRK